MIRTDSAGRKINVIDYTSAREIQAALVARAEANRARVNPGVLERWISTVIRNVEKEGRLMTDRQLADFRAQRSFRAGDRARFIGRTRQEKLSATLEVPRPHGQVGTITSVRMDDSGKVFTFHPSGSDTDQVVDMEVREYTPGWLCLERIPT